MELKDLTPLVPTELKEKPVFPTYGLPDVIKLYAENLSNVYGVPVEMVVVPMLVACGSVLKKSIRLETKKYTNYPQFYVVINAPSGVGKSEPLSKAFAPLQAIDRNNYSNYCNAVEEWKLVCAENKTKKPPLPDPPKPKFKQLLINDTTPEALIDALQHNAESMTVFADELSGWFGNFGRYNKSSEAEMYLSFANNKDYAKNRKIETTYIKEPFVSICGGIQPTVLTRTINSEAMQSNGLAPRFLYVTCTGVQRAYKNNLIPDDRLAGKYSFLINHLAGLSTGFGLMLELTPEANELFQNFGDYLTDLIRTSKNEFLNASLAKMEIHCLRLALVVQIIKCTEPNQVVDFVTDKTMQYAIDLCHYFISNIPVQSKSELVKAEGKNLKILEMLQNGMTQVQIAKEMNVSQQYISTVKRKYKLND